MEPANATSHVGQNRLPEVEGERSLSLLESDLESGVLVLTGVDWPDVFRLAENLSKRHTASGGPRALDVLHVATALHLGAEALLTFDANQRRLAMAAKLKVRAGLV